jgi:uncharacterized RDD family membrane protein YckC
VLDWLVAFALNLAAGVATAVVLGALSAVGAVSPDWVNRVGDLSVMGVLSGMVAGIIYETLCEGFGGATIGKAILGLRVRSEGGAPARLGPSLVRSLAFLVDGMFFGAIAYGSMSRSRQQQRLGDKWSHTVVVRARSIPPAAERANLALGIALGCIGHMLVTSLAMALEAL